MALIYRFQGRTLDTVADPMVPGTTGYNDLGVAHTGQYSAAYANILAPTTVTLTGGRVMRVLRFKDNALGGEPFWSSKPGISPNASPSSITGAWSARLYFRRPSGTTVAMPVIRFQGGNTTRVYIYLNSPGTTTSRFRTAGSTTGTALASGSVQSWFRLEIQCDPARTPKLVVRVYEHDGTTPVSSFTESPAATDWDNFDIGHFLSGNYTASEVHYGDIEVHDDYDLGGQFTSNPASPTAASESATGVAATTPSVASRFRYDETLNRTLPAATLTEGTHYTKTTLDYAGSFNRKVDLYKPTGTPPSGGWPVVCWAHSGFFYSGTRDDLPAAWRDDLLNAGYAVASIEYVRTSLDAVSPYDSYGDTAEFRGARYPSFIVDYKRAAAYLRDNASTHGLNGAALIATGFSAGGYLALAAVATRDLAADSGGTPMSLAACAAAGNPWADGYTGADPEFLGCFVYAAPVDMDLAQAWDPTWPNAGGSIQTSYRAFQGLLQTGTSAPTYPRQNIASHIGLNAAKMKPVIYVRGTADYLVHWAHQSALATAMSTHAATIPAAPATLSKYVELTTPNNHDRANLIYDRDDLIPWLNTLVAASLPAGTSDGALVAAGEGAAGVTGSAFSSGAGSAAGEGTVGVAGSGLSPAGVDAPGEGTVTVGGSAIADGAASAPGEGTHTVLATAYGSGTLDVASVGAVAILTGSWADGTIAAAGEGLTDVSGATTAGGDGVIAAEAVGVVLLDGTVRLPILTSRTTPGMVRTLLADYGALGGRVYRDESVPEHTTLPYASILDDVSVVATARGDGRVAGARKLLQVDLWIGLDAPHDAMKRDVIALLDGAGLNKEAGYDRPLRLKVEGAQRIPDEAPLIHYAITCSVAQLTV